MVTACATLHGVTVQPPEESTSVPLPGVRIGGKARVGRWGQGRAPRGWLPCVWGPRWQGHQGRELTWDMEKDEAVGSCGRKAILARFGKFLTTNVTDEIFVALA